VPHCPPTLSFGCHSVELDRHRIETIGHDVARRLSAVLEVRRPLRVEVLLATDGGSWAQGSLVRLCPRAGGGLSLLESFEMLLAHELTHVLVRECWGLPPALVWEGLSVHLGDAWTRARVLGRTYHTYCRVLGELGVLPRLEGLMSAAAFYRWRPDSRVDLAAGSFCGFLLATRGAAALRAFVADLGRPTAQVPRWVLVPAMRRHLGADLAHLEREWIVWLQHRPEAPELRESWASRRFDGPPRGRMHCDVCFAPRAAQGCVACGEWARGVRVDIARSGDGAGETLACNDKTVVVRVGSRDSVVV